MRIDVATAQKLITNYRQNHWTIVNGCCPSLRQNPSYPLVQDSRSVWFSIEELQSFINAISQTGGNGIRFYFGEYSGDIIAGAISQLQQSGKVDPDTGRNDIQERINKLGQCEGLETLVMLPTTYDMVNNVNRDYNLMDQSYNFNPNDMTAENHGGIVPPPFDLVPGQTATVCGTGFMDYCDV